MYLKMTKSKNSTETKDDRNVPNFFHANRRMSRLGNLLVLKRWSENVRHIFELAFLKMAAKLDGCKSYFQVSIETAFENFQGFTNRKMLKRFLLSTFSVLIQHSNI